jgi:hypothetical protein
LAQQCSQLLFRQRITEFNAALLAYRHIDHAKLISGSTLNMQSKWTISMPTPPTDTRKILGAIDDPPLPTRASPAGGLYWDRQHLTSQRIRRLLLVLVVLPIPAGTVSHLHCR